MLRDKIADLITNELFERFGSPSSAVIGVQLADRIVALIVDAQTVRVQHDRRDPEGVA